MSRVGQLHIWYGNFGRKITKCTVDYGSGQPYYWWEQKWEQGQCAFWSPPIFATACDLIICDVIDHLWCYWIDHLWCYWSFVMLLIICDVIDHLWCYSIDHLWCYWSFVMLFDWSFVMLLIICDVIRLIICDVIDHLWCYSIDHLWCYSINMRSGFLFTYWLEA